MMWSGEGVWLINTAWSGEEVCTGGMVGCSRTHVDGGWGWCSGHLTFVVGIGQFNFGCQ